MTTLAPCPFCGGGPATTCAGPVEMCDRDINDRPFWVVCRSCDVAGPRGESTDAAIAAWNSRAPAGLLGRVPEGWVLQTVYHADGQYLARLWREASWSDQPESEANGTGPTVELAVMDAAEKCK